MADEPQGSTPAAAPVSNVPAAGGASPQSGSNPAGNETPAGAGGNPGQVQPAAGAPSGTTVAGDPAGGNAPSTAEPVLGADGKPVAVGVRPDAEKPELSWSDRVKAYAGDDAKKAAALGRYATDKDAFDALLEAKEKIRSGQLRTPFPKDGTPEVQAEWRAENGLPESAEKYDLSQLKAADGRPLSELDMKYVKEAASVLHGHNFTNDQLNAAISLSYQIEQKRMADLQSADVTMQGVNDQQLRSDWGPEYQKNKNLVDGFLAGVPEKVRALLQNGRLSNGSPIFQDAESMKYFANLARELNPMGTVTAGTGLDKMDNVHTQIAAYETRMRTDGTAWHKDQKAQAHYRELLDFRIRMEGQAKRTA